MGSCCNCTMTEEARSLSLHNFRGGTMPATFGNRWNLDVLEQQFQRWRRDSSAVDEGWRAFFEGFELGQARRPPAAPAAATAKQAAVIDLIDAYRGLGHILARLDPLSDPPASYPL